MVVGGLAAQTRASSPDTKARSLGSRPSLSGRRTNRRLQAHRSLRRSYRARESADGVPSVLIVRRILQRLARTHRPPRREVAVRGVGIPQVLIEYLPSMLGKAPEFYSCFISYSHPDKAFARRLHDALQGRGIRCWLDEHQLPPATSSAIESPRASRSGTRSCSAPPRARSRAGGWRRS